MGADALAVTQHEFDCDLAVEKELAAEREQKRMRAAVGALVQEGSVLEALLASRISWESRRALATTCKTHKHYVAEYFKQRNLSLHPHDCTDDTFHFLIEQLLKGANPDVKLVFSAAAEGKKLSEPVALRDWFFRHWATGPPGYIPDWLREGGDQEEIDYQLNVIGETYVLKDRPYPEFDASLGFTASWFLGRAWTMLPDAAKMRFKYTKPMRSRGGRPPLTEKVFDKGTNCSPKYGMSMAVRSRLDPMQFTFLSGCYLRGAQAKVDKLIKSGRENSNTLYLHHTLLDGAGMQTIADQLHKADLKLTTLHMSRCASPLPHYTTTLLLDCGLDTSRLQNLRICNDRLPLWTVDRLVTALIAPDGRFPELKTLDLSSIGLLNSDVKKLALGMVKGGSLHLLDHLNLSSNCVTGVGLAWLVQEVISMPELNFLNVAHLDLTHKDVLTFARRIQREAVWTKMNCISIASRNTKEYDNAAKLLKRAIKVANDRVVLERKIKWALTYPGKPKLPKPNPNLAMDLSGEEEYSSAEEEDSDDDDDDDNLATSEDDSDDEP